MNIHFTLTMNDVVIRGMNAGQVILEWEAEASNQEILELTHLWVTTPNFLSQRIAGLTRVGESHLSFEPA